MTTRRRSSLRQGYLTEVAMHAIRQFGAGIQFTFNDMWEMIDPSYKRILIDAYEADSAKAQRALANGLRSLRKYGVRHVETHRDGGSVFVWMPPSQRQPEANGKVEVGQQVTFTLVGFTSDNKAMYREDRTGRLGWVEWDEL